MIFNRLILFLSIFVCLANPAFAANYARIFDALLTSQRSAGVTLSGGKAYFYIPGTETLKTVYSSRTKTIAANPFTLSADGTAQLYGDGLYDVKITNSAGVQKYLWEDVSLKDASGEFYSLSDYADLSAAVTAIGSTPATILIASNTTVPADLTIPATLVLKPINGALITVNSGKTLTFSSQPDLPKDLQVFTGAGTVVGLKEAKPEWFGSGTDAIQKSLNAATVTRLSEKTYYISGFPLLIDSGKQLVGAGMGKSIINPTGGTRDTTKLAAFITNKNYPYNAVRADRIDLATAHLMTADSNIILRDFTLIGAKATIPGFFGISFWSVTDVTVDNVEVDSSYSQGIMFTGAMRPVVKGCKVHHNAANGIHISDAFDGLIENNQVWSTGDYGIEIGSGYLRGNDAISTGWHTVTGNTSNNNANYGICLRGLVGGVSDTDGLPYNPNLKPLRGVTITGNVTRLNVSNVGTGIGLQDYVSDATVAANTTSDNKVGILITGGLASDSTISGNTVSRNSTYGLLASNELRSSVINANVISYSGLQALKGTFTDVIISNNPVSYNNTTATAGLSIVDTLNSNGNTFIGNIFKLTTGDIATTSIATRTTSGTFRWITNIFPTGFYPIIASGDLLIDIASVSGTGSGLGYTSGLGTPVGVKTPNFTGQDYFDTATGNWWKAFNNTNTGWNKLTN